jgi:hypothetical protein
MDKIKRIAELREELENLQESVALSQRTCRHSWGDAVSDPEFYQEPSGYKLVGHGSDAWHEPTSYHTVSKPRWKRACKLCHKVEYTYEQKPVKYEPLFK